MGYCMSQRNALFHLPRRYFKQALRAVRKMTEPSRGSVTTEQAESLPKMLSAMNWDVEQDAKTGDIVSILFVGERSHEDLELFKALAPFVWRGSFIAMDGEDGCLWRWWFDGQTVHGQSGRVVYK